MGFLQDALGLETLSASAPAGDYSANVTPPARSAGPRPLTVDRALGLSAVFAAFRLIVFGGSQLTLEGWRGGAVVTDRPHPLVTRPDPWRTLREFLARYLFNALSDGNNFIRKHRLGDSSTVLSVTLLDPNLVSIRWPNGVKVFDVYDVRRGTRETLTEADVLHVWCGLPVPGLDRALGPITAARVGLSGVIDVRDYAAGWFDPDAAKDVPSGVLSTDQRLDPDAANAYKRMWLYPPELTAEDGTVLNTPGGPTIRVIGQGLKYDPILLKPADAQWLESQTFGVLEVARWFGIPEAKLAAAVEGSSLTYANRVDLTTEFYADTLFPVYLKPLEDALTELLPNGQSARFNAGELLRPDAKAQAEIDTAYITAGVYDGAHVRSRLGIPGPAPKPKPAPTQEVTP